MSFIFEEEYTYEEQQKKEEENERSIYKQETRQYVMRRIKLNSFVLFSTRVGEWGKVINKIIR
jgi:hypothetical protein